MRRPIMPAGRRPQRSTQIILACALIGVCLIAVKVVGMNKVLLSIIQQDCKLRISETAECL